MTKPFLHPAALLRLSAISFVLLLVGCVVPPQPVASTSTSASSAQLSVTPSTADLPNVSSESASITSTAPSIISATISLTESQSLPQKGSKGENLYLPNADTAINQNFAEWLATTGATVASLTPDVRAASPTITVTLLLEDEVAAETIKNTLPELDALLLAEAGTMMAIQLPVGNLDQLSQLPGVLLIQTPASAPPTSQVPFASPLTDVGAQHISPNAMRANGFSALTFSTSEEIAAWANSIPIDWSTLKDRQTTKLNYLPLADTVMNSTYQRWHTSVLATGSDLPQAAWFSDLITITLIMQDEASATAAKATLPTLNIQVLDSYAEWLVVLSPVGQLQPLMELSGLLLAQQPTTRPPIENTWEVSTPQNGQEPTEQSEVAVVTQGVARSKINAWHNAGFRGQNVRVAILDSFDQEIIDDAFAKKEIPTKVLNGPSDEGSNHGIAVAEIVYDMAPQAIITLHSIGSAPDFCIAFANTLENLAKQGVHIISSSISPSFCPSAGNGATNPISQAATRVLTTYNTLYVQAAGNNALHHYEKAFKGVEVGDLVVNNFASSGESTVNVLVVNTPSGPAAASIPMGTILQFFLRWDGGWPRSAQDYDLYLVYFNGSNWVFLDCIVAPCKSENVQNGSQMPFEGISTLAPFTGAYGVVITKYDADGNHFLDLLTGHAQPFLNFNTPNRSLIPAASSQNVFSIAAVDVNSLALENYSSRGPTYGPGNSPTGGFAQPRLAAYANVATYVSPGFNGTSSATPHVAGAAAVLKSAGTCLSARQLGDWLTRYATDKGAAGYDNEYGSGVLNFPAPNSRPVCYPNNVFVPNIHK